MESRNCRSMCFSVREGYTLFTEMTDSGGLNILFQTCSPVVGGGWTRPALGECGASSSIPRPFADTVLGGIERRSSSSNR